MTVARWPGMLSWFKGLFRWPRLPAVKRITVAASLLDDLSEMARSAHPKEMLAFLASSKGIKDGILHLDEIHLQAYDASDDSAHVFLGGLPVVTGIMGTVHSHPGGSPRPSDADRGFWNYYGLVHAILPEPYGPRDIVFYDKNGRRITVVVVRGTVAPR